ncbi:tyrosine-type recombinase/integrase [Paraflavitalea speifideaquila]|uniref:tyrosine-type recombinase/integrase n=1 Tax=Paraflavitalea speifideaquila TaxID=3076558 RepID=UPI003313081D
MKKHLYSAKHTGADNMVEAGLDLREVQYLYGHESEAMTKRYNKKKKEIEFKRSIIEKAPRFVA